MAPSPPASTSLPKPSSLAPPACLASKFAVPQKLSELTPSTTFRSATFWVAATLAPTSIRSSSAAIAELVSETKCVATGGGQPT